MSAVTMTRRTFGGLVWGATLGFLLYPNGHQVRAADAGQRAPDFKLPSTMGRDITLSDFRGKKWVLLEFYGADFSPT